MPRPSKQDLRNALAAIAAAVITVLVCLPFLSTAPTHRIVPRNEAERKLETVLPEVNVTGSAEQVIRHLAHELDIEVLIDPPNPLHELGTLELRLRDVRARYVLGRLFDPRSGAMNYRTEGNRLIVPGQRTTPPSTLLRIYDIRDLINVDVEYRRRRNEHWDTFFSDAGPWGNSWHRSPSSFREWTEQQFMNYSWFWGYEIDVHFWDGRMIIEGPPESHRLIEDTLYLLRKSWGYGSRWEVPLSTQ